MSTSCQDADHIADSGATVSQELQILSQSSLHITGKGCFQLLRMVTATAWRAR